MPGSHGIESGYHNKVEDQFHYWCQIRRYTDNLAGPYPSLLTSVISNYPYINGPICNESVHDIWCRQSVIAFIDSVTNARSEERQNTPASINARPVSISLLLSKAPQERCSRENCGYQALTVTRTTTCRLLLSIREFGEREAWAERGSELSAHWLNRWCEMNVHIARKNR
jgi:hypothetical protein